MGKASTHSRNEVVIVPVHGHREAVWQVIFKLHSIRHRRAVLAHIGQGSGEQVGMPLLSKSENHRSANIEGVSLPSKAASRSPRNQIALKDQGLRSLRGQL